MYGIRGLKITKVLQNVQAEVLVYTREGEAPSSATKLKESKSKKWACERQGSNIRATGT